MGIYNRTLEELSHHAVRFWPEELTVLAADASVLPILLETQDKFLSVLKFADAHPVAWLEALALSSLSGNLFLKHLMVLSDLGGEALNKIKPLRKFFTDGNMNYTWQGRNFAYCFTDGLDGKNFANSGLKVDGKSIAIKSNHVDLNPKMQDIAMLILFAGQSIGNSLPESVKTKCTIGTLIGRSDELEDFVKKSYIRVSSQLRGADSNALGQLTQDYVIKKLKEILPQDWRLARNGTIPGVGHKKDEIDSTFDVVVESPTGLRFGVEVSFQVTTNSVIERKSAQAQARQIAVHLAKHYIAYVLDGAGSIDVRKSASETICNFSDCTVAFSEEEIRVLANFMLEKESGR